MPQHIILITDTQERALITESILVKADCIVSARLSPDDDWSRMVGNLQSDVVFIALESSSPEILNGIRRIGFEHPMPIVLFVDKDDVTAVNAATDAGVSAYVIDGFGGQRIIRIRAIISAAIARFNTMRALQLELNEVRTQLSECKAVAARSFQMKQHCYEDNVH